jgi:hypothetical protein
MRAEAYEAGTIFHLAETILERGPPRDRAGRARPGAPPNETLQAADALYIAKRR